MVARVQRLLKCCIAVLNLFHKKKYIIFLNQRPRCFTFGSSPCTHGTDRSLLTRTAFFFVSLHGKNETKQKANPNYKKILCFLLGDLIDEKPISLHELNGCECPSKTVCPEGDKRSLFYDTETEGCTVLKASLVKVCDYRPQEIFRIACINGYTLDPDQPPFKYIKNRPFEAEGHLLYYLESVKDELANQVNDGQCQVEFWMVLNNSPCYTKCSGANTENPSTPHNIPNMVRLLKSIIHDENLTVRIAFGRPFTTRDPKKEPQEKMIKAIKHLLDNYHLYLCELTDEWWADLDIEDTKKATLKENWSIKFNETMTLFSSNNLNIKMKQNCTYPGEVWKNPNGKDFFIGENWE